MAEDRENRTEEPTPRRLEKAREEGQVPRSVELTAAVVLLAAVVWAMARAGSIVDGMRVAMSTGLTRISAHDLTPDAAATLLGRATAEGIYATGPLLLTLALAGLVANVAQIGLGLYPRRLMPDASRLSIARGIERMFSPRGLVELVKNLLKIGLVAWLGWHSVRAAGPRLARLGLSDPHGILDTAGREIGGIVLLVAAVLGAIAAADWFWQRREHQQSLRMTRQEVRDEHRQSEGDPRLRQRFRKAQRDFSANRMLSGVAQAQVVITNPTHIAVALAYDAESMGAPRVVAKGAEEVAARIRAEARRHGVPIIERRPLARALFRAVPVGGEIPAPLYRAVAEILAWVYGLAAQRAS